MTTGSALSRHSFRVAIVIASALIVSAGRAEATCGDYVKIVKSPLSAHHDLASTPNQNAPDRPALPKAPCTGPNCSGHPDTPTAPIPVSSSDSSERQSL